MASSSPPPPPPLSEKRVSEESRNSRKKEEVRQTEEELALTDNEEEEDEGSNPAVLECVCCASKPRIPPAKLVDGKMITHKRVWSRCCCCLFPSKRAPEMFLLICLVGTAISTFWYSAATFMNVGVAQSIIAPPLLLLGLLYSAAMLVKITWNKRNRVELSRMTMIGVVLALVSCLCFIAPLLANYSLVAVAHDDLVSAFPQALSSATTPPSPESSPFSSLDWFKNYENLRGLSAKAGTSSVATYEEVAYKTNVADKGVRDCSGLSRGFSTTLLMDVYRPKKPNPAWAKSPVLFHVHGGGWSVGDKSWAGWSFSYFLERGYTIVSSQYSFTCYGYTAQDMHDELSEAYTFLASKEVEWNLDLDRVTAVGESAGGHLATWLGYTQQKSGGGGNAFSGVVNIYGPSNFELWETIGDRWRLKPLGGDMPCLYESDLLYKLTGGSCTKEAYRAMSPTNFISPTVPPTFTFHGEEDSLVPVVLSDDLHERLTEAGVENLLVKVKAADHVLDYGFNGLPGQLLRYDFERFVAGGTGSGLGNSTYQGHNGVWIITAVWAVQVLSGFLLVFQYRVRRKHGQSSDVENHDQMELQMV